MRLRKNCKGLTLIEVVIALAILTIVLVPILNISQYCLHNYHFAGKKSQLVKAGKGVLEIIIAEQEYSVRNHTGKDYQRMPGIKYDVDVYFFNGSPYLRAIDVQVYWENDANDSITFTTVRFVKE